MAIDEVRSQARGAASPGPTDTSSTASALPNPLVGRIHELEVLDTALAEASAGRGKMVLLAGDSGIGKTRLAMELCTRAQAHQAAVVWGRCWEGEGAPAFWPWVQMVRQYMSGRAASELRADLGLAASDVARVIPDLGSLLNDALFRSAPPGFAATPEHERFRFFDGLTQFWLAAARRQPIVLVFDDLQWADHASLRLWEFMAREMGTGALLMLALYREDEIGAHEGLRAALGAVLREPVCQRVALSGLADSEVAQYVELLSGRQLQPPVLDKLTQRTQGNPFFVGELVRLLAANGFKAGPGWERALPIGVRHAVARRLAATSIECNRVLSLAAAIGQEFDVALLGVVAGDSDVSHLLATLQPAEDAALIRRVDDTGSAYAFTHAMVQETLLANLTAAVRAWVHGRIGTALEEAFGHDSRHFVEMARHFLAAGDIGADKAYVYARRAGDASLTVLAYDESVQWYERALQLLERRGGAPDPETHCELLLALGDVQMRAGMVDAARLTSFRAAEIARRSGDGTRFARAALGFGWSFNAVGVDHERIALLEQVLAMLPTADSSLRVRVMARLATALFWLSEHAARRATLRDEAVKIARRLGDPATLAFSLNESLFASWEAVHSDLRARYSRELLALAEGAGEHELTLQSRQWLVTSLLEEGDLAGAQREIALYTQLARRLRQNLYLWNAAMWRTMEAFLHGPMDAVESLAEEALRLGERVEPDNAQQAYSALLFCLRREQGRLAEFLPVIEAIVAQPDAIPGWRRALAIVYLEVGRHDDANRELSLLRPTDAAIDDQLNGLTFIAEVAAGLRRRDTCSDIYELLQRYAKQGIVLGMGIVHFGSASRHLGLLASVLGRFDDAERHFAEAQRMHERIRSRPLMAHTQHDLAAMLCMRDAPGDRERASALLATAVATARELGMGGLEQRGEALLARVGSGRSAGGSFEPENRELRTGQPLGAVFRRSGDLWQITFAGASCELRDARGLQYLAYLLQRPGEELHATELVNGIDGYHVGATAGGDTHDATVTNDLGSASGGLDAAATGDYQRRLLELREELTEADHDNDLGRSARLREELAMLTEELAHAGRARRSSSHAERARVAVTKAVRAALARIARAHPALGDHLEATIRTGYFCSYTPDPNARLRWMIDSSSS